MTALWTDPETGIEHDLDAVKWDDTDKQYRNEVREIDLRFVCRHEVFSKVWSTIQNGTLQLRNQCANCGALVGTALKKELALPNTPQADTGTAERWEQARADALRQALIRFVVRQRDWWSGYSAYLETDEWRRKRELVFQRARGMCEGCRERPAQQVHHLTYANVGNEFLWQLVAVCSPCHERFHSNREAADQAHKAA